MGYPKNSSRFDSNRGDEDRKSRYGRANRSQFNARNENRQNSPTRRSSQSGRHSHSSHSSKAPYPARTSRDLHSTHSARSGLTFDDLEPRTIPRSTARSNAKKKAPTHIRNVAPSAKMRANTRGARHGAQVGKASLTVEGLRKQKRKRRIGVVICVVFALILASFAGVFMYFKTTDRNLGLNSSNASQALVSASKDQPFYTLCVADLSNANLNKSKDSDFAIMLLRVDVAARQIIYVGIPSRLNLKFSDGKSYPLNSYPKEMGDAGLISAISTFADVPISHFVKTNAKQIEAAVKHVDSVDMNLLTEIDDPSAGFVVIDAGEQAIDASEALVLIRATNVANGFAGTSSNRVDFTQALLNKVLDTSKIGLASAVSAASDYIETDFTTSDLLSMGEAMQPFSEVEVFRCVVPSTETTSVDDGSKILSCNQTEWDILLSSIKSGEDPSGFASEELASSLRNSSVEIRNGASIDGAASSLSAKLEDLGYKIEEVGNTYDGIIYPDTLIIYTKPENQEAAKNVLGDLPKGRLVNGGDYYSTKSDVLVIIGADWTS